MSNGVPNRCDPPSSSPLLDGWSEVNENVVVTTTTTISPEDGISIPSSGVLCGEVVTTEPPDEEYRACKLYTITALQNNSRDAVVSVVNCQTREVDTHTIPPNSCLFVYSLLPPTINDPGFGSTQQTQGTNSSSGSSGSSGSGSGSGSGDNSNTGDDEEQTESEELSITDDSDGDGIPDKGVIVNIEDCTVVGPGGSGDDDTDWTPTPPTGGGETSDGAASGISISDAGTGGGSTGQPGPSGATSGPIYTGPESSGMFCGGLAYTYDEDVNNPPVSPHIKIVSVGAGNIEDSLRITDDGTPASSTLRPNAIYLYKDASNDLLNDESIYSTYVQDKDIPTEYDSEGITYQGARESAFNAPRQIATQVTIRENPSDLTILWDNYRNPNLFGNLGYTIVETTVPRGDDYYPRHSVLFSDAYHAKEKNGGGSYNNSAATFYDAPAESMDRTYRYRLDDLSLEGENFSTLSNYIPNNTFTIDRAAISSPEFFSWIMDEGVPAGYGWDSGSYRLYETNQTWAANTITEYEHKIIPINFDDTYYITEESVARMINDDEWVTRGQLEQEDVLEFKRAGVLQLITDGYMDVNNKTLYLEVCSSTSYTYSSSYRPDGSHYIYGNGPSDERMFPKLLLSKQTKRDLFGIGPSGEIIPTLTAINEGSLIQNTPGQSSSDWYEYYTGSFHSDKSKEEVCFITQGNTIFEGGAADFSPPDSWKRTVDIDYWHQDFNRTEICHPSGTDVAIDAINETDINCLDGACCEPFTFQSNWVYSDYQDFATAGSGYVPVNFYPCTIVDKIGSLMNIYNNPNESSVEGLGQDFIVLTQNEAFEDIKGCYYRASELRAGKYRYIHSFDSAWDMPAFEDPDLINYYEVYYESSNNRWVLRDWYNQTLYATSNSVPDGLIPPTQGWTNIGQPMEVEFGTCQG